MYSIVVLHGFFVLAIDAFIFYNLEGVSVPSCEADTMHNVIHVAEELKRHARRCCTAIQSSLPTVSPRSLL
jgi:hypothetical protein